MYGKSGTKRLFDLLFSGAGLMFSAPLWILIALGIKFEDGGPVFFEQERVGKGGTRFTIRKFRSMTADAGARLSIHQAGFNDERVTAVGRILRATGADELPQLWNILKGEMSFVGPRPLLPQEIEVDRPYEIVSLEDIPGYEARHQVTPGLTGLAQIFASRHLPRRKKFRLDILYIRNQSLLMDIRFIALSCWIVLRGSCGEPWVRRRQAVTKRVYLRPARAAIRPAIGPLAATYAQPISSGRPETKVS
jgi:lipopolysaccharide/colanic/teichoic acid biosynthesis glycosyltransferase